MADMLMKSAFYVYGCDCSQCRRPNEQQQARQAARRREEIRWRQDQEGVE